MRGMALLMITTILLVPLAGCTGPDGEVTVDITSEELQQIIDDNQEDFLNNTTVVVFQEYHNNTTVVNNYNNSTDVDQSGTSSSNHTVTNIYNGSNNVPEMYVLHLEFTANDVLGPLLNKRENNFTTTYQYYDYATNDDRTDEFTLSCSNYYDVVPNNNDNNNDSNTNSNVSSSNSYWDSNDYYWSWWDYTYNNTIRDLLSDKSYSQEVLDSCYTEPNNYNRLWGWDQLRDENGYYDWSSAPIFHTINIANGTAINIIQAGGTHQFTNGEGDEYNDPYLSYVNNGLDSTIGPKYGGWEDLEITFHLRPYIYVDSIFTFTMYYELLPVTSI